MRSASGPLTGRGVHCARIERATERGEGRDKIGAFCGAVKRCCVRGMQGEVDISGRLNNEEIISEVRR